MMKPSPLAPYEWALAEWRRGVLEIVGPQHNPRIVWYHGHTGLRATDDETPWCSAFMCAAAEAAGFRSTRSAAARSWLDYGVPGDGSPGDIAILKRGSSPTSGHVAFFHQKYVEGKNVYIELLGGNQGNRISVVKYKASDLLAIRRFPS